MVGRCRCQHLRPDRQRHRRVAGQERQRPTLHPHGPEWVHDDPHPHRVPWRYHGRGLPERLLSGSGLHAERHRPRHRSHHRGHHHHVLRQRGHRPCLPRRLRRCMGHHSGQCHPAAGRPCRHRPLRLRAGPDGHGLGGGHVLRPL